MSRATKHSNPYSDMTGIFSKLMNAFLKKNQRLVPWHASHQGSFDLVQELLAKGVQNLDWYRFTSQEGGWSSLMRASGRGHVDIVRTLLGSGAKIDCADNNGVTSLLIASVEVLGDVKVLLARGADIYLAERHGMTHLLFACQNGHCEIVKALLGNGANIHLTNQ
ncbi:hypothetical protein As57867_005715, partial [Aphanomyces stellatus]